MGDASLENNKLSWFSRFVSPLSRSNTSTDARNSWGLQQMAWNVVVAGVAIAGGYLAMRFTSGEEEFESEHFPDVLMGRRMAPVIHNLRQLDDDAPLEDAAIEKETWKAEHNSFGELSTTVRTTLIEDNTNDVAEEDGYFGDAGLKPFWVDELLQKLERVDTKLDEIRLMVDGYTPDGKSQKTCIDASQDAKITDFYKIEKKERNDLLKFQKVIRETRASLCMPQNMQEEKKPKALDEGLGALRMYIKMIIDNPDIPRYRRIATSNQSYKNLIAPIEGHEEFLKSIGFTKKNSCYEWSYATRISDSTTSSEESKEVVGCSSSIPDIDELSHDTRLALLKNGYDLL